MSKDNNVSADTEMIDLAASFIYYRRYALCAMRFAPLNNCGLRTTFGLGAPRGIEDNGRYAIAEDTLSLESRPPAAYCRHTSLKPLGFEQKQEFCGLRTTFGLGAPRGLSQRGYHLVE